MRKGHKHFMKSDVVEINMSSKSRKKKLSKDVEEDLIAEVQRLRMENAYLKKLQALVQKRTKPKQSKK